MTFFTSNGWKLKNPLSNTEKATRNSSVTRCGIARQVVKPHATTVNQAPQLISEGGIRQKVLHTGRDG
ncbi:hypothetical protein ERICI_04519 [Paenibacillus larvae subsp. larvae]|nr:hypothetical protein ERICI_04519 [Paenibacillus larvae subsp. larvae]